MWRGLKVFASKSDVEGRGPTPDIRGGPFLLSNTDSELNKGIH